MLDRLTGRRIDDGPGALAAFGLGPAAESYPFDAPTFTLSASVGKGGENKAADVTAVKQRLKALGFSWVTSGDKMDDATISAIRLFQSMGRGVQKVSGDGRIDVPGESYRWLQASNAPCWRLLPAGSAAGGYINIEIADTKDQHDYGSEWLAQTLGDAGAAYQKDYRKSHAGSAPIAVNDTSLPKGGDTPDHAGHETGLACDVALPKLDGTYGKITYKDTTYDRDAMEAQIRAFLAQPLALRVFLNDQKLIDKGLCSNVAGHDNHAHFEIKAPKPVAAAAQGLEIGEAEALSMTPSVYPNPGGYSPASDASLFRCVPSPVALTNATLLPQASTTADDDTRAVLKNLGLSAAEVTAFEKNKGVEALRPIATFFGGAALEELLRRLRYTKAMLKSPPHTYKLDGKRELTGLGIKPQQVLAIRTLIAIPGHFRMLARRAPNSKEAYALENIGWLLMEKMRLEVNKSTGKVWWLPSAPPWSTKFPSPAPSYSKLVNDLIKQGGFSDSSVSQAAFDDKQKTWGVGPARTQWSLETGENPYTPARGRPLYDLVVTQPASVNIAAQKQQIDRIWAQRVAATKPPKFTGDQIYEELKKCGNQLSGAGLVSAAQLQGLQFTQNFPLLDSAKTGGRGLVTRLSALTQIVPVLEELFRTVHALGWHDLMFQTEGAFCFRGNKIGGNPQAALRISNHGYGIAVDLHVFENPQGNSHSTHDPRIVALFEYFRFRWGKCFGPPTSKPDPHHFDYVG